MPGLQHWQLGDDVYTAVRKIVSDVFDVPEAELTPETHFVEDLHESLEVAETVMACEKYFGLEIPDQEVQHLLTVGLLADYIEGRLQPNTDVWPPAPRRHRNTNPDAPH